MHKQLQKFGFFTSKDLEEEPSRDQVKFLYKKNTVASHQRQIKSANDASPCPRHSHGRHFLDEKPCSHRKNTESKSNKQKNPRLNSFASETEIFFISPEDLKKNRTKMTKHQDRKTPEIPPEERRYKSSGYSPDAERRRSLKREIDATKFNTHKHKESDLEWLTKKEIVKMISNKTDEQKKPPSFLKKFFFFEKQQTSSANRYVEDNTKRIFEHYQVASGDSSTRKIEKNIKKKHKDDSVERDLKKHRERTKSVERKKERVKEKTSSGINERKTSHKKTKETFQTSDSLESSTASSKPQQKIPSKECDLIFDEPKTESQKRKSRSRNVQEITDSTKKQKQRKHGNEDVVSQDTKTQNKGQNNNSSVKHKKRSSDANKVSVNKFPECEFRESKICPFKEIPRSRASSKNREALKKKKVDKDNLEVESKRQRFSLVENTFPVVEILPLVNPESFLEKKKKRKVFKKYYKYNKTSDCDESTTSMFMGFSDSNRMYQGNSEYSFEEAPRNQNQRSKFPLRAFKIETHISAIVIDPEPENSNKEIDTINIRRKRSKIPILSSVSKSVESAKQEYQKSPRREIQVVEIGTNTRHSRSSSLESKPEAQKKTFQDDSEISEVTKQNSSEEDIVKEKELEISGDLTMSMSRSQSCESHKETQKDSKIGKDLTMTKQNNKKGTVKMREPKIKRDSTISKQSQVKAKIPRNSSKSDRTRSNALNLSKKSGSKKDIAKEKELEISRDLTLSVPRSSSCESQKEIQEMGKDPTMTRQSPKEIVKKREPKMKRDSTTLKPNQTKCKIPQSSSKSGRTRSPLRTYRKYSATTTQLNETLKPTATCSSSKRSLKEVFASKSDTKIPRKNPTNTQKKYKNLDKTSAKTSLSSDKTLRAGTSFLVTKTFKDSEKLNRWQRSKLYSDTLRKKFLKKKKTSGIPTQIMEVRCLTVEKLVEPEIQSKTLNFLNQDLFEDDLPEPYLETGDDKFKELFDEILNENYNFLQKDFTSKLNINLESSDDLSSDDLSPEKELKEWYDLGVRDRETGSFCRSSCCRSKDRIVDSVSAHGSEESGYSTIKSYKTSRTFFERPEIKALLRPFGTSIDYCTEVQIGTKDSVKELEMSSIESKSLQTSFECLQESVQISLSKEELHEKVFSRSKEEEKSEEELHEMIFFRETSKEEEQPEKKLHKKINSTKTSKKEEQQKEEKECEEESIKEDQEREGKDSVEKNNSEMKVSETNKSLVFEKVNCVVIEPETEVSKKRKQICDLKILSYFCCVGTDK